MTEMELTAAIDAAQKQYHELSQIATAAELEKASNQIVSMKKMLAEFISTGAVVCPCCKQLPFGMKKTKGVYEVGCRTCKPVQTEAGQVLFAAQGETAEEAVENWNAKQFRVKPLEQK